MSLSTVGRMGVPRTLAESLEAGKGSDWYGDRMSGVGAGRTVYDVAHQVGDVQLRVHLHRCVGLGASAESPIGV